MTMIRTYRICDVYKSTSQRECNERAQTPLTGTIWIAQLTLTTDGSVYDYWLGIYTCTADSGGCR